jgi:hypothetical protein
MRDFASAGSSTGDEPLPPVTTHRAGADGQQPKDEGVLVPPFLVGKPGSVSEDALWEGLKENGEGEVIPAFGSPPDEAAEDIPSNAFFIPEGADHVPTGIDPAAAQPAEHRETETWHVEVSTIAERLEMVARRLRSEGAASLSTKLAAGDSLDTLLAGLLAGYLAAHRH